MRNSKELSKMNLWAVQIFKLFWVGLIRWDWWLRHVESDLIFVKMCISRRPILTCKKITNHKEIQIGKKRFFLSKKKESSRRTKSFPSPDEEKQVVIYSDRRQWRIEPMSSWWIIIFFARCFVFLIKQHGRRCKFLNASWLIIKVSLVSCESGLDKG